MQPILLVHGGAGDIPESRVKLKLNAVRNAALEGHKILMDPKGTVLDAVEAAVKFMEDDESCNAGRGSVLNLDGEVEMDAIIMEGKNLQIGSVAAVKNIRYPISLARLVMERTKHVMLAGEGANRFAKEMAVPEVSSDWLITDYAKETWKECIKNNKSHVTEVTESIGGVGTVGAVAVDADGHVAVATSTGGTCGKLPGRVGDTPIPGIANGKLGMEAWAFVTLVFHRGSGGYCDDKIGAVSTTGHGESIMRHCVSFSILRKMEMGESAGDASRSVLDHMAKQTNMTAGAITVSSNGDIGIYFNSRRMAWAYQLGDTLHYGINKNDDIIEKVP